jgi:hypothetical protein
MAFPPRPRSARSEPSFASRGAAPHDAVPIRPVAARSPSAKPTANDAGLEREPPRFAPEHRNGELSLSPADRLVVSSARAGQSEARKGGGFFRFLGFAVLLGLAAIGALSVYHWISPFLI